MDEGESGAPDALFQKYQRAERRRLAAEADLALHGNQIAKSGAGSVAESRDEYSEAAALFKGTRHVMTEASNSGHPGRTGGLKEAAREVQSSIKA